MQKEFISVPPKYSELICVKYAQEVVSGKVIAGKYIILECIRFLKDLNKIGQEDFEWDFNIEAYNVIIGFQNFFKFADGINAGKTMKLADFQIWILANIFCWHHAKDGYIRFSKAYIQVARKQGKSFICGMIMIIKSLLDEYSQLTCVASKKDQAEIVIKEVKKLLDKAIPELKDRFDVYGRAKISKIICSLTQSEIYPLSSDVDTLDGLGLDTAIVDEWGIHPNYELYEVCRSSQTYKVNSQIIAITTAYSNPQTSPAYKERCQLIDTYEGKLPMDDRYFSAIYELDSEDDWRDKSTWGKSNPLFVQFPTIMKKLESDFENVLKDPQKLQLFLTKNLNIWLDNDTLISYLDFDEWKSYQVDQIDLDGMEVICGVDMSKSTDLTGISFVGKGADNDIFIKATAFLPSETINLKETSDKLPYSSYLNNDREWLKTSEGKFVNQKDVEAFIREAESKYNCRIIKVAFDSWGAIGLMSSLDEDFEVIDVKMTYKNFSPAIKRFRELVYEGKVQHEYNPVLNFCVGNAITKSDLQENILLDKKKSTNRIDLLVATIIAYSEWFMEENEQDYGDYFTV